MLEVKALSSGYGAFRVLHDFDLTVEAGSIVALLGANGAGKTTTLLTLAGLIAPQGGQVIFDGRDITALAAAKRAATGIALAPEGRRLFPDLTVDETLTVGGYCRPQTREAANRARVFALFPRLAERAKQAAGTLSGGEQQMLAIGRALMAEPRLLLIDELSLGLMPKAVDLCYEAIARLKTEGLAILLVEQSTQRALALADQAYVLASGQRTWAGSGAAARADNHAIEVAMGLRSEDSKAH